jgi:hypothetical protein
MGNTSTAMTEWKNASAHIGIRKYKVTAAQHSILNPSTHLNNNFEYK